MVGEELGALDVEMKGEQGDEKIRQPSGSDPMDDGRSIVSQTTDMEADGSVSGESGKGKRRRMDSNRNDRSMTSARLAGRNNDPVVGWWETSDVYLQWLQLHDR